MLGARVVVPYFPPVSFLLRLTGTTNAALWFGAAAFFLIGVWPAFSSAEMLKILPPLHAEAAAHLTMDRYFVMQSWCGFIALAHFLLEWLYAGKPLRRGLLYLVAGLLSLSLFSGLSAGPKLKRLHLEKYGVRSTGQQRQNASEGLRLWRRIVLVTHLIQVLGLWVYMSELHTAGAGARLVSVGKFRG